MLAGARPSMSSPYSAIGSRSGTNRMTTHATSTRNWTTSSAYDRLIQTVLTAFCWNSDSVAELATAAISASIQTTNAIMPTKMNRPKKKPERTTCGSQVRAVTASLINSSGGSCRTRFDR